MPRKHVNVVTEFKGKIKTYRFRAPAPGGKVTYSPARDFKMTFHTPGQGDQASASDRSKQARKTQDQGQAVPGGQPALQPAFPSEDCAEQGGITHSPSSSLQLVNPGGFKSKLGSFLYLPKY